MTPWWLGLSPAQTTVSCAGHAHRIRWEAGALRALDHDDPEGERVLSALGAERCTCLDILDAWQRHEDDPRVLVLASRGPTDPLAAQAGGHSPPGLARPQVIASRSGRARGRSGRGGGTMRRVSLSPVGAQHVAPTGRVSDEAQAENDLITLLQLGGGLQNRLVATIAATWQERLGRTVGSLADVRPRLHAALHGRGLAAMRTWLGAPELELGLTMIGGADPPGLLSEHGVVRAELPFGWLAEVWAKGIATIWGRFCIAASTTDGETWTLLTVGPDFGPPAPITVALPRVP